MKVTILQWNVWFQEKADNVLRAIEEIDADTICLQELTAHSAINPQRNLPVEIAQLGYTSHFYYPTIQRDEFIMGNGIFSKYPMETTRHTYVRQENIEEDLTKIDPHHENRVYVEATLKIANSLLTIGTVHLSFTPGFEPQDWKDIETNKLIDTLRTNRNNFVFTGDLNALPDSGTIASLSNLLKSAGPDLNEATWTTKPFNYQDFIADKLNWRLDYVFTTPDVQVLESKTITTDVSDHLPILTTIEL